MSGPVCQSPAFCIILYDASDTGECVQCNWSMLRWFLSLREQLSWVAHPELISASCHRLDGSDRSAQRATFFSESPQLCDSVITTMRTPAPCSFFWYPFNPVPFPNFFSLPIQSWDKPSSVNLSLAWIQQQIQQLLSCHLSHWGQDYLWGRKSSKGLTQSNCSSHYIFWFEETAIEEPQTVVEPETEKHIY